MSALDWLVVLCVGAIALNTGMCLGHLLDGRPRQ